MTGDAVSPLAAAVGVDSERLASLVTSLAARRQTVACAESLTGGLLAAVLTSVPGASAVIRGGIVCYATDLKASLVGVDPVLLNERGPVDPAVAQQLAAGVRERCGATFGLGLTGVAGPDWQGGRPPGTVYVALAGRDDTVVQQVDPPAGEASRDEVRAAAVRTAVALLESRT